MRVLIQHVRARPETLLWSQQTLRWYFCSGGACLQHSCQLMLCSSTSQIVQTVLLNHQIISPFVIVGTRFYVCVCVCCVLLCLCLSMWMCVPKTWVSSLKSYLVPLSFLWPIDQTHCYAMSPTLQWACLTSVYNCWCWCWIVAQWIQLSSVLVLHLSIIVSADVGGLKLGSP